MSKIAETVWGLASPIAVKHGCEIWDVEYLKEAGQWFLRIYVDKRGGVSIDDCEAVSRDMDEVLDEKDPIPESYIFEVSSAGAERELKRPSDFERFIGSTVEVRLYQAYEGQKAIIGELRNYDSGNVTIRKNEEDCVFRKEQVAKVRLRIV